MSERWTVEEYQEAARSVEIAPSPDGMCHLGICSEEKCGHCSRKATIRAMLKQMARDRAKAVDHGR